MIFLFFVSSLGPLEEPELAPFKDFQEIGDIWKISGMSEIDGKSVRNIGRNQ